MENSVFKIHPSVGVARVGNSVEEFYLAPESIGGTPISCDEFGNAKGVVKEYKDSMGAIKRQGTKFRIYRYDMNPKGTEVTLDDSDVQSIEWRAHIANKKAAFWNFSEQVGNTMISPDNTYEYWAKQGVVSLRNSLVTSEDERRKLIIDPGPRILNGRNLKAAFSKDTIPPDYTFGSFPSTPTAGFEISTLGDLCTDVQGRLTVIAAFGNAGGNAPISSYAGADTWHDDTADGQIECKIIMKDGTSITLTAWVICASTKFAPQLVNITALSDIMLDVAVRFKNQNSDMYDIGKWGNGWNPDYIVNYDRDILPILTRPKDYIWVANVPSMTAFSHPQFDTKDNSEENKANREEFFSYWRNPVMAKGTNGYNVLWDERLLPLMPMTSGTNSVTNQYIEKFLTLTQTQYYFLSQWTQGRFSTGTSGGYSGIHALDEASVGNCVGLPMSPGIEVTWSVTNPAIYDEPYRIKIAHDDTYYSVNGLNPLRDETAGRGCEPGDLSKRMAIPWQADFFQCTIQFINFTDPDKNKSNGIPLPPTYYSYWWPPQSPWDVIAGTIDATQQSRQGVPAGVQVNYARGINSFAQMITAWKYLGFIVNQNLGSRRYPYFVEKERNDEKFEVAAVAIGGASVVLTGDDSTFLPAWYLKEDSSDHSKSKQSDYFAAVRKIVADETAPVDSSEEQKPFNIQASIGRPRSGTRVRF